MVYNKDLSRDDFIDPNTGKLNQSTYRSLKRKIVFPRSESLLRPSVRDNLAIYGMQSLGGSLSRYSLSLIHI